MEIKNMNELEQFRKLIGEKNFNEARQLIRDGGKLSIYTKQEFEQMDQSKFINWAVKFLRERFEKGSAYAGFVVKPMRDLDFEECVHMPNRKCYEFDINFR